MEKFFEGFEKRAGMGAHLAEVAGLGMLAVPSIQHLRKKPMSESKTHKYELAGLGTLAAPSAYHIGKKVLSKGKA
jgi:hypothetical protein